MVPSTVLDLRGTMRRARNSPRVRMPDDDDVLQPLVRLEDFVGEARQRPLEPGVVDDGRFELSHVAWQDIKKPPEPLGGGGGWSESVLHFFLLSDLSGSGLKDLMLNCRLWCRYFPLLATAP